MALTAREGVGRTVERQVAQSHIAEEMEAAGDFWQEACRHLGVVGRELQMVEEIA